MQSNQDTPSPDQISTPPGFPPSSSYSLPLGVSGYVTPKPETEAASASAVYPSASPYAPLESVAPPPPGYVPPPDYPSGSYPPISGAPSSGVYMPPSQIYQPSGGYSRVTRQERRPLNNTPLLITLVGTVVLLLVVGSVAIARNVISAQNAATPNAALVSGGSTTTEPISHHFQIGQQVQIANTWLMTVNSATASTGNQVDQQQIKAGDTFALVDLTIQNTSASAQDLLGYVSFAVQDDHGTLYPQEPFSGQNVPDGSIAPGQQVHGLIAFAVPTSQHHLTFSYNDPTFGASVLWDVNV